MDDEKQMVIAKLQESLANSDADQIEELLSTSKHSAALRDPKVLADFLAQILSTTVQ